MMPPTKKEIPMGKPSFAPPPQATDAAASQAQLPEPMELPSIPDHPEPGDHGMPELTGPMFPELSLPDAADVAAVDLPDIPAADLPEIFDI
jgi:hypothetical protein